tara:strand:+ start:636 stop:911 length:276 start_codon:yes stop_codon:yes gene_type:complete
MKQYKIWNDVYAPSYKSGRAYGTNETTHTTIYIGTSSKNSFEFLKHKTKHTEQKDGTRLYEFFVDGVCVKSATYNPKNKTCIAATHTKELN